jgi:hypothetical protein
VNKQIDRASALLAQYRVEGTPAIVVGGQYLTDTGRLFPRSAFNADAEARERIVLSSLVALTQSLVEKQHSKRALGTDAERAILRDSSDGAFQTIDR